MPKRTKKSEQIIPQSPKGKKITTEKKQQVKPTGLSFNSKTIEDYIGNKGLVLAISLILVICLVVFKDFIFMKFVYLFKDIGSDSINVDYPAAVLVDTMHKQQNYFTWTFYGGMGYPMNSGVDNPLHPIVSIGAIFLPFIKAIFGSNPAFLKFPFFLMILLLTGITSYLYFRTLEFSSSISLVGSLLVSFMGYNIASSAWSHYYDVFNGIFLLFAFEQFYKKNRWYFLPIAIMMISYNFFNLYVYGVFLVTYFLFRFFTDNEGGPKKLFQLGFKITALSIFGLIIGAANYIPNLINAMNSPRVSGNIDAIKDISIMNPTMNSKIYEFSTALLRTFSSDMMGTGNDFKGWYNYLEAPLFYCGLISLLLIAQVFVFLKKRDKLIFGLFAGLWIFIAIIPEFRNAFHLHFGNYYKVGINFFIPIIFIFYGIKSLSLIIENKKVNLPVLVISLIVLLVALFYPYKIEEIVLTDKTIRNYAAFFLVIYTGLIYLLSREKYQLTAQIAILALLIIELTSFSYISVTKRTNYKASEFRVTQGGYNDNTMPALAYIKSIDNRFYRIEKDYSSGTAMHTSLNDSQAQGYFGTTLYSSFNQPYYIEFLKETDIIQAGSETGTRWAPGLRSRPLLQTFASVKYNLSKTEKPFMLNAGYSFVKDFNDVKLLQNNYFIPFGYCYSNYITLSDFRKCSSLQKDISLLRAFVVDENSKDFNSVKNNFKQLQLSDTVAVFNFEEYKSFVDQRRKDTLQIAEFKQNYIKGNIKTDSAKMFFASIPFDKGWSVKIDGKSLEPQVINVGFLGFSVSKGTHVVEMEYFPKYLTYSLIVSFLGSLTFLTMLFFTKELNLKIRIGVTAVIVLIFVLQQVI